MGKPMRSRRYKIARKIQETANTLSVFLVSEDAAALESFRAGQHLAVEVPGVGDRNYVLSAFSAQPRTYRLTIVHGDPSAGSDGAVAYWTKQATKGDVLEARGPEGGFHLPAELTRPVVVLSKDIGEAAVTPIAEELAVRAAHHHAVFLHGTFNSATFALKGKLASLKADLPQASWKIWFSHPLRFDRPGRAYDLGGELDLGECLDFLPQEEFDVYVCGPDEFVARTEAALRGLGTRCRNLFTQSMGVTVAPPVDVEPEGQLPPLAPQAVTFARSGKQGTWTVDNGTLLEFAESLGIKVPFSCRTGMCGTCAHKIVAGDVVKVRQTTARIGEHHQLLCSTVPVSALTVEL